MTHVLFWDIDGTLLTTARAGVFALEEAARGGARRAPTSARCGPPGSPTPRSPRLRSSAAAATTADDVVAAFLRAYERRLPDALPARQGRVLPGVREILDALAGRDGRDSLLLTGNTPAGAEAKLRHYGLTATSTAAPSAWTGATATSIARRARDLAAERLGELAPTSACS